MELLSEFDMKLVRAGRLQYGPLERRRLSRAATCRCCGKRMAGSTDVLRFNVDFTGSGSWTTVACYVHAEPCEPVNKSPVAHNL
jgi:hypothetical protein